jgi:hypothetical protein
MWLIFGCRVYAWINFNTVGVVLVFLPIPFVPMFIFPWVVTSSKFNGRYALIRRKLISSVTAALIPLELSNVFYRISYAYPSHGERD